MRRPDRSISRSVSGELTREEQQIGEIRNLVEKQQEYILNLLTHHKSEVDSKLQNKQRRFGSRQLEKQYQINGEFKEQALRIQAAVAKGDKALAEDEVGRLLKVLEKHEEDLVIADTSPHGWLAVAKVRAGAELPKVLRKKLDQVNKDLAGRKPKRDGQAPRKPFRFSQASQEPYVRRPDRRVSPEEALFQAGKQLRTGTCSRCQKGLHYYKECLAFWRKVLESREAKAKDESN